MVFDTISIKDEGSLSSAQTLNNYRFADEAMLVNPAGETVGQIDIGIVGQWDTTADLYATLLDATGPGGAPGNTLWSSSVLSISFAPYEDIVSFTVPNIHVPQSFFWAIEIRNILKYDDNGDLTTSGSFGPQYANMATVLPPGASTSTASFYIDVDGANGPGGFTQGFQSAGNDSTFAVKIFNSVPEPAAASLLALGGAGIAVLLRRRRRA